MFWSGDLNYRVTCERDVAEKAIQNSNLEVRPSHKLNITNVLTDLQAAITSATVNIWDIYIIHHINTCPVKDTMLSSAFSSRLMFTLIPTLMSTLDPQWSGFLFGYRPD